MTDDLAREWTKWKLLGRVNDADTFKFYSPGVIAAGITAHYDTPIRSAVSHLISELESDRIIEYDVSWAKVQDTSNDEERE